MVHNFDEYCEDERLQIDMRRTAFAYSIAKLFELRFISRATAEKWLKKQGAASLDDCLETCQRQTLHQYLRDIYYGYD